MIGALVALIGGLVVLTVSADWLVVAATAISRRLGLSTVLIGAVIVGLGTSAPELSVSVSAARSDELGLAVGNVVGSNIANVTLVLGAAALLAPLFASVVILRREGVLMLASVVALALVLADGQMSVPEGLALAAGMVVAIVLLVLWARGDPEHGPVTSVEEEEVVERPLWFQLLTGGLSLGLILLGAELLVTGATDLAELLGWSATFVGLLIVAIGTSLPELATALAAARRRETNLVIGNVLGSNLFNSLFVAGGAAIAGPGLVDDPIVGPSTLAMVAAALVAGIFSYTGGRVARTEGVLLVAGFVVFAVYASVTGAPA